MPLQKILDFFTVQAPPQPPVGSVDDALLQKLAGAADADVALDQESLDYYAIDGSVFTLKPKAIVFPATAKEVVKTVQFVVEQAKKGVYLPLSARGRGSDQAGGPLGEGIIVNFAQHMTAVEEVSDDRLRVQPGARYGEVQTLLKAKGKYLPPYPASIEIATIGGAVANNSAGEKTVKYGATRDFVERLEVVLSNGDLIETKRLNEEQLAAKKKLDTFEGCLYREVDKLITQNNELIDLHHPAVHKNSAGYNLWDIKQDGYFDLSQLIVGSQGTLGLVTDITFRIADHPKRLGLSIGYFHDLDSGAKAVKELLHLRPSAVELVDRYLIDIVLKQDPKLIFGLIPKEKPAIVILAEFDDQTRGAIDKKRSMAQMIFKKYAYHQIDTDDPKDQERIWKIRRSAAAVMWTVDGSTKAVPIIEDAIVSPAFLTEFFEKVYALFNKYGLAIAIWGHAGDGNFHMQPFLDLGKEGDREKLFKVMDEFYQMVYELHGSPSAEHNDGILRSPYLPLFYGKEMYNLFYQVKKLFDPQGILNPHKKIGVTREFQRAHLRHEYSMAHLKVDREKLTR